MKELIPPHLLVTTRMTAADISGRSRTYQGRTLLINGSLRALLIL